jgi:hypothetical protein
MSQSNLVRAACFSHREPFLVSVDGGIQYQVMTQLIENQEEEFTVTVSVFNLESLAMEEDTRIFQSLKFGMDWIVQCFEVFEPHGPPEVLYLPSWESLENTQRTISTWAETLFGLDSSFNIINKFDKTLQITETEIDQFKNSQ